MIIVAYDAVYCMYMPCYTLTNVYGLFKETYLQAIICAVVAVVGALVCGLVYWPLVMLGPVLYYLSSLIFRLIVAKRKVAWLSLLSFIRRMVMVVISVSMSVALSMVVYTRGYLLSWWQWTFHGAVCAFVVLGVVWVYSLIFERSALTGVLRYVKQLIMRKIGRKKTSDIR